MISVTSNVIRGLMRTITREREDAELNAKLQPLMNWLFIEPNLIGVNTALAQLGIIHPLFCLLYLPLDIEKRRLFVQIVESIGREHFVGDKPVQVLDDVDFLLLARF